jgi:curved DNA-binding protein CbpA
VSSPSSSEPIVGLGNRSDYLAVAPGADFQRLTLLSDERLVLASIGRTATIDEIVARSGLPEPKTIAVLLGLRAKGVVVPARAAPAPRGAVDASTLEEVDLEADRKAEILALEGLIDTASHYDMLGVSPTAGSDEIRRAYHEASRRFHPDRYFQKNLGSFRARIERLFRRVNEAHSVLSDPERRAAYDRANPDLFENLRATPIPMRLAPATPSQPMPAVNLSPERAEERRARLARHPYFAREMKRRDLATEAKEATAKGDLARAVTLMSQAVQMEPANEALRNELAELRRRQGASRVKQELARGVELEQRGELEKAATQYRLAASADPTHAEAAARAAAVLSRMEGGDLREAKALAQRAVDLLPKHAGNRVLLAKILVQADLKKLARRELEEAVRLDPGHPEAKALLKKLKWPF